MKVWKFDDEIGWYQVEERPIKLKFKSRPTKISDLKHFTVEKRNES